MQRCSRGWLIGGIALLAFLLLSPAVARADGWLLWDWSVRMDSATFNPDPLPPEVNAAGFDFATGLGTLTLTFGTPGAHIGGVYLYNFETPDPAIWDLSNAYGDPHGAAPAGVTWEIAWPGDYLEPAPTLYDRYTTDALRNSTNVSAYAPPPGACCSVAMAMLHAFNLNAGETATLSYIVAGTPSGSFYLSNTNHDSGDAIYLSENLRITGGGTPGVPEPAAIWLLLTAGAGTLWARRRARQ